MGSQALAPLPQLFPVPHPDPEDGLAGTSIHTWFCHASVDAGPCQDTKGLKGGILSQLCTHTFLKSNFCVISFDRVGGIHGISASWMWLWHRTIRVVIPLPQDP